MQGYSYTEQTVSDLARSDAVHDFGKFGVAPADESTIETFNASVRTPSTTSYDEKGLLNEIFKVKAWEDKVLEFSKTGSPYKIGAVSYGISSFKLGNETGEALARKMGIPQTGAVFVIDFNQHGILDLLKTGARETATPTTIYHILAPEVINDPAGKTPHTEPIFSKNSGVNIIPCVEIRDTPVVFPGDIEFNQSSDANALLYSKYFASLSPIEGVSKEKIPKKYVVNLTIQDKNQSVLIKDSKKNNSIKSIVKTLEGIFKKIREFFFGPTVFKVASSWLQKRSGDWLQAIASRTINGRNFIDGLRKTQIAIPENTPVYFVTHDQIALTYALLIGCNVIYIRSTEDKDNFIFTNQETVGSDTQYDGLFGTNGTEQAELDAAIQRLTKNIELLTQFYDVPVNFSRITPDLATIDGQIQNVFKELVIKAYVHDTRKQYIELLNGLKKDDNRTKYLSLQYSKQVEDIQGTLTNERIETRIKNTTPYQTASTWNYLRDIPNKRTGVSPVSKEYYDFLVYIAKTDDDELKGTFATTFSTLSNNIDQAYPDTSKERVRSGFKHLSNMIFMYTGFENIIQDPTVFASLLLSFSSRCVDFADEFDTLRTMGGAPRVGPKERSRQERASKDELKYWAKIRKDKEKRLQEKRAPSFEVDIRISDTDRFITLIEMVNRSGNARFEGLQKGGASNLVTQSYLLSPILGVLFGLEGSIEKLEGHPSVSAYGQYIKFIEYLSTHIRHNEERYATWELLNGLNNSTEGRAFIADILGLTPEQYTPFAMMSTSTSHFLFGELQTSVETARPGFELAEIKTLLQEAVKYSQTGSTMTHEDVQKTHEEILANVFSTIQKLPEFVVQETPVLKTGRVLEEQSITQEAPTMTVGTGRKTYKSKHSKSSRRTKRVRRSDRAKQSETQSSH
jgi:hypothetical protein